MAMSQLGVSVPVFHRERQLSSWPALVRDFRGHVGARLLRVVPTIVGRSLRFWRRRESGKRRDEPHLVEESSLSAPAETQPPPSSRASASSPSTELHNPGSLPATADGGARDLPLPHDEDIAGEGPTPAATPSGGRWKLLSFLKRTRATSPVVATAMGSAPSANPAHRPGSLHGAPTTDPVLRGEALVLPEHSEPLEASVPGAVSGPSAPPSSVPPKPSLATSIASALRRRRKD